MNNHATLIAAWRAKADDLMRISKSYTCRSNEAIGTAYIKQAWQLRACADELEKEDARLLAVENPDAGNVPSDNAAGTSADVSVLEAERDRTQEAVRPSPAGEEPQDQAEGPLHVPGMRSRQGRARPAGGPPSADV